VLFPSALTISLALLMSLSVISKHFCMQGGVCFPQADVAPFMEILGNDVMDKQSHRNEQRGSQQFQFRASNAPRGWVGFRSIHDRSFNLLALSSTAGEDALRRLPDRDPGAIDQHSLSDKHSVAAAS
jgi:hypothetical protein